jgi:hypothetical protein
VQRQLEKIKFMSKEKLYTLGKMKDFDLEKLAENESIAQGWGTYEGSAEQVGIKKAFINGYKNAEILLQCKIKFLEEKLIKIKDKNGRLEEKVAEQNSIILALDEEDNFRGLEDINKSLANEIIRLNEKIKEAESKKKEWSRLKELILKMNED